jgi:hypothetical protein
MSNFHATRRLTAPDGSRANIDVLMVPLIKALWAAGYETVACCQDIGEATSGRGGSRAGCALLEMPVADTCRLVDTVRLTLSFRDRMRWSAPGAWKVSVPIPLSALPHVPTSVMPWAQIFFPADQMGELVGVITEG